MSALKIIVTVIYCIVAIAFTASVLMQEGKSAGLGAIGGMAESYWGKNKGRSMEGKLERFTLIGAIIFFVGAILLNMNFLSYSSHVPAKLDKSNACMKIYRVGWTEWTPVNEQNRAAKQRHTKGVVL